MRPLCRKRCRIGFALVAAGVRPCGLLLLASMFALQVTHAAVCDDKAFQGDYDFLLTGTTTIGGPARPVAAIGRLSVDSSGAVAGIVSASFTGLTLGNPVRGTSEAHTDCSVEWSLQDDSGSFQHFAGTMTADGGRVAFHQSDPGGAENGILRRTMDACSDSSLSGQFRLKISGETVDIDTGVESGKASFTAFLTSDGAGGLSFATGQDERAAVAGTYHVQSDCFVEFALELAGKTRHFRAIMFENGHEVQGIETDPGMVAEVELVYQ